MAAIISIGLTGGIATGKSTVGHLLRQRGIKVSSADELVHLVMEPGGPAYDELIKEFGREILAPDGSIDRRILGKRVFEDPLSRRQLERIVHPIVINLIKKEIETCSAKGVDLVVVEAPLLFESGIAEMFDLIWVVSAAPEIQLQRLLERDQLSEAEARQRIAAQMPLAEKEKRAHAVIINNNGIGALEEQITTLLRNLE